ncbi:AAA family ATPase [Sorangium sp. So ce204]|uniref:AAA family ATPase n=1 Tax=Sorangium sp. So ce204 TaxID=3133288 RepID=UPI003F61E507
MYLKRLILKDLKGIRSLDFSFERRNGAYDGWTVITGDNGAGKTALLRALALAIVGPDVARALQPSLLGWIGRGGNHAEIAAEIVPERDDGFATGRRYERSFWSELDLVKNGGPEVSLVPAARLRRGKKGPLNGPWAENTPGWFAAGYGPFRRLYGASPEAQRLMVGPSRVVRFATMFKEDATLGECEIWLKDLNYKALEKRPKEIRILESVMELLNHDFLQNGIRVEKIDSDGLWLRDARGTVLPLADMSEGYRAALAVLVDIVRHMVVVYGLGEGDKNLISKKGGRVVAEYPGIVLVDEVDAHLHPEWQRRIGFWLKEHFPRIQFIVTTHSPLICQAADEQAIYHLPAPGSEGVPRQLSIEEYWEVVRGTPTEIYRTAAFGMRETRSSRATQARREHAQLKAKEKAAALTAAEVQKLKQLELFADPS